MQNTERAAPTLQQIGWRQKQQQRLSISRAPVRVQRVPSGATYTSCVSHGQQQTHGHRKRPMRIVMMPQCFSMMYSPPGGAPGGPEIGATGATGTAAATGTAGTLDAMTCTLCGAARGREWTG